MLAFAVHEIHLVSKLDITYVLVSSVSPDGNRGCNFEALKNEKTFSHLSILIQFL